MLSLVTTNTASKYPTYVSEGVCMVNSPTYGYLAVDDFKSNYTTGIVPAFSSSSFDKKHNS